MHRCCYNVLLYGHCSAKHGTKARKNKSSRHLSFTHSLNKHRKLDAAERQKLKQKQRRKLRQEICNR